MVKKNKLINKILLKICPYVFVSILIPIFIHFMYKIPSCNKWFESVIDINELLNYSGTVLGSLVIFITAYLSVSMSLQTARNDKLIEKMAAFLEQFRLINLDTIANIKDKQKQAFALIHLSEEMNYLLYEIKMFFPEELIDELEKLEKNEMLPRVINPTKKLGNTVIYGERSITTSDIEALMPGYFDVLEKTTKVFTKVTRDSVDI